MSRKNPTPSFGCDVDIHGGCDGLDAHGYQCFCPCHGSTRQDQRTGGGSMSDVERIAEVIAVELARQAGDEVAFQPRIFDGITREGTAETVYLREAGELVAVLKSHGFGHVPTALHQAADELEDSTIADINNAIGRPEPEYHTATLVKAVMWLRNRAAAVTEGAGE